MKAEKKPRKTKNSIHDYIVQAIERLVKPESLKSTGWAKEYKIFQKLFREYPDKRIWANITYQVNSLAWFITDGGKEDIQKVKNKIDFELKEVKITEVGNEKVGDDVKVAKPFNIKDFLEQYGK